MTDLKTITINNTTVRATSAQQEMITLLRDSRSGFATLKNYKATTGFVEGAPKVCTVTVNSMARPEKAYSNVLDALRSVTLAEVEALLPNWVANQGRKNKNQRQTLPEQFARCMEMFAARCDGRGSESHKKAHDDNSFSPSKGVKVWLNKDADEKGVRSIKSVLVFALPVSETIHQAGEKKTVNLGSKTQVDKAIESIWNKRKCTLKTFDLTKAESVSIDGKTI